MSSASPFRSESAASTQQRAGAQPLRSVFRPAIQFAGFWAAIVLPFVLLVFVATGLATQHPGVVGAVLLGNIFGLMLGQGYNR